MVEHDADGMALPEVVREKLAAFERMRADFETGFQFVQEVHGQRRLETFPLPVIVRYLRALWICDLKDRLLSVPYSTGRYDGHHALAMLLAWQDGDTASVVDFLQAKLDMLPFGQITHQLQEAVRTGDDPAWVQRLTHGRKIMLNRSQNLDCALETIFTISPDALTDSVRMACAQHDLAPDAIRAHLAELESPIYGPMRHQALAQRNMLVMNAQGVRVTDNSADRPGQRTDRVVPPTIPAGPYAEHSIIGAVELVPAAYGTYSYIPGYEASAMILNNPDAPPEPTGVIERHPDMV